MDIALTTRWNAGSHLDGESMIEEILELGFSHIELGYDTRLDLVPGILTMVESAAVKIDSVHNFCPVPMSTSRGHPEIYTFADRDLRIRDRAVRHTAETLRFAAQVGARVVVSHSGNVDMTKRTMDLLDLAESGQLFSDEYDRILMKAQDQREKKARKQFPLLIHCLEQLVPVIEETRVTLALEVLPTWEAFPSEMEFERIFQHFESKYFRYWHDFGHAKIRENLGFINMERWMDRLSPHLAGMHIHDVIPPGRDHVMPPHGDIDFPKFKRFAELDVVRVIEPPPNTPGEEVQEAIRTLREAWPASAPETEQGENRP